MTTDAKNKTALQLVGVVIGMGALAWAAVPLYDLFCRVTGFGGEPGISDTASDEILDQTIKVKFDASLARDMPWQFKPVAHEMEIRIGETGLAFYEAYNPTDVAVAGTASFNVAPYSTGGYFTKIDCFCFELQVLEPGQRVQMPVTFYVDPEILEDDEARFAQHITLSYTFHVTDIPEDYASLTEAPHTDVN